MTEIYVHRGEVVQVPKHGIGRELTMEINWEVLKENSTNMDVCCILFDGNRTLRETVSLFQPQNTSETGFGAITHLGAPPKQQQGREAEPEIICLQLSKLDPSIRALMFAVTSPNGDFSQVEAANVSIRAAEKQVLSFCLGCQGKHTALLLCALYKGADNVWFFMNIGDATVGRHVKDIDSLMSKHMRNLILNKSGDVFNLNKGDTIDVPDIQKLGIGFAWKKGGIMEVHSCLMLFDTLGRNNDDIYYVNAISQDRSVEYVDPIPNGSIIEEFTINLPKVAPNVNVIVGTITIYSMDESMIKSSDPNVITDVSCRFKNRDSGKDICKYECYNFGRNNSQIVFKLFRKSPFEPNNWKIVAVGYSTQGNNVVDLIPDVQEYFVDLWEEMFKWSETEVAIVSATGLRSVNGKSFSNPFAKVVVDRDQKLFLDSDAEKETINPIWDFSYETDAISELELEIWHKGVLSSKFLGRVVVDVQGLPLEIENDLFVNLTGRGKNNSEDEKVVGSVHLKITKKR